MQTVREIKALLASVGAHPKHALGQNFLIAHDHITRLVDASGVTAGSLVLEVGPGTGTMTDELLARGCEVILSELDADMCAILRGRFGDRVTLVEGDCLESKHAVSDAVLGAIGERPFTLVANLPYGAASPLMVALATTHAGQCLGQFVTIQREVGQRVRAQPSTRDYSELTVLIQAMCAVERIATLPPGCFWPQPKVTSEMLAIVPRSEALTGDPGALARLCRTLFTKRRKQLGAIIGREGGLPEGVTHDLRPEALTVEQLVELSRLRP